jgi:hypothetical protein
MKASGQLTFHRANLMVQDFKVTIAFGGLMLIGDTPVTNSYLLKESFGRVSERD